MSEINGDVKIKVIDSDKLINAINEGSYEVNLSAVMLDTKKQESARTFVELVVEYPDPELYIYKEYKGKPYYSIKYIENVETHVGYGTYKPEVLSQFLKEYFIPSVQSEHVADIDKNDLISRQAAIELKPEFLNPNVNRETEEQTAIDRAYARGWNACNTHWIDEISELPSDQSEHTCVGCKHYGLWENEIEYGCSSPCTNCRRRMNDNYEQ